MIFMFVEKKKNEKECFLLYYSIQQHMINMILIMFYVFLGDNASHITQYPTVSTPYPTPVSTYSAPSATPNSIPSDINNKYK